MGEIERDAVSLCDVKARSRGRTKTHSHEISIITNYIYLFLTKVNITSSLSGAGLRCAHRLHQHQRDKNITYSSNILCDTFIGFSKC